ncbi:MAG: hypothetical protein ACM30G_09745, partial [Micromonosporaceae bacterium]
MHKKRRTVTLVASVAVVTAAVLAVAVPAEAATSTPAADRPNSSLLSPSARQAAGAADVVLATTDEIRAMAVADGNEVLTFSVKRSGQALVQKTITCYPSFTSPYGPNTAGSSVRVDAYVYCDDWVHSISLRPQIYRSNSLVASALYAVAYSNFVAGSVSTSCLPASYFSAITAIMTRYDATPQSLLVNWRSLDV